MQVMLAVEIIKGGLNDSSFETLGIGEHAHAAHH